MGSEETSIVIERWPDLPEGINRGISARVGDTLFVGLGSAGASLYALDLSDASRQWAIQASFPGPAPSGAACAASGGRLFVFGGVGKTTPDAATPIVFDAVHAYDATADVWAEIDARTPCGLLGAKAATLVDGRIVFFGGYNKQVFEGFVAGLSVLERAGDIEGAARFTRSFLDRAPEDYRWNAEVLCYDPAANVWSSLGASPCLPNCDAALVETATDKLILASGEIKPGLRTPEVKAVAVAGAVASWQQLAPLPTPPSEAVQEGVAGAFAGTLGEKVIVAGGTNFVGAWANAANGKWYAHEGLTKGWRTEIYALGEGGWSIAGQLPEGLGYGASFSLAEGVLLVGGEDGQGASRAEVFCLRPRA
ncbi:YjhT family mutarotase [Mesorhizobium sp. ANAO-SY3R2]|uniref:YjhT family mutarotase n=1 Tax=Mesorhizobium sp. ANAO-SY3R2 TaxID=3166644 RepID=UPI00366B6A88